MLTLYMYTCIHCNSCIAKEDSYLQTDTTSRLQICIQQYGIIWHQETLIGKSRGLASNHQQLSPSSISASRISRYSGRCPDIFCQITRQETQGPVRDLSGTPGLTILIRTEAAHRISLQPQPEIIWPLFIDTMQTIVIFIFAH